MSATSLVDVPAEIRALPRWLPYVDKRPYRCDGGGWSKWDHPANFDDAVRANAAHEVIEGIGLLMSPHDDWFCLDLDSGSGVTDAPHVLSAFGHEVVNHFKNTCYVEFSPSGRGLHVIGCAERKP